MADILLSYERTDRQRVAPIVALLEACGWSVQWEPAGEDQTTESAAASCVIAAWSIDSVESDAVWAVAGDGLARGVLVSVSIDFSRVPRELESAPSLALAGWTGDASSTRAQQLLALVGDLLAKAAAQPPRPPDQPAAGGDVDAHPASAQASELAADHAPAVDPQPQAQAEPEFEAAIASAVEPEVEPEIAFAVEPEVEAEIAFGVEPEVEAEIAFYAEPEVEAEIAFAVEPEVEAEIARDVEPEVEFQVEPEVAFEPAAAVPVLFREEGAVEPAWAFPEEPEEEARASRLPPVLLRDRGRPSIAPPILPDAPTSLARRGLAAVLVIGLAMVGAAGVLWLMPGGPTPDKEVAAVETAPAPTPKPPATPPQPQEAKPQETEVQKITPQEVRPHDAKPQNVKPQNVKPQNAKPQEAKPKEVQPTPAALPKDLEIEDLLGQVTPRVEELLAGARRLVRIGDIRGAREVLAAPETAHSGALTFLLAETYDPNVLPVGLKAALADAPRARALYRKARDLGEGRAQGRLDAL